MKLFTGWQLVVLICFGSTLLFGVCIWAISAGFVPPSFLFAPLGVVVTAAATGLAHRFGVEKGFEKGLNEMPPNLEGAEIKIVKTLAPPTLEGMMGGAVSAVPPEVEP